MQAAKGAKTGSKRGSSARGGGRVRGNMDKHGGSSWTLETDFDGEGSGYQQQRKSKRKRNSTGGTFTPNNTPNTTSNTTRVPQSHASGNASENASANDYYKYLSSDEKLSLILTKLSTNETSMTTLQVKFDKAFGKRGQVPKLESQVRAQSDRLKALEYKSIDLEARSRRNNLLFKGFDESRNENCAQIVANLIRDRLLITDDIPIQRAHRLGKYSNDRTRFIIVAFSNYADTERIMAEVYRLKGLGKAISRDYPAEIVEARKTLWTDYSDLRKKLEGTRAKVAIVYPAKLLHNGRVVRDMFPDWNVHMRKSRAKPADPIDHSNTGPRDQQTSHKSVYDQSTDTASSCDDSASDDSDETPSETEHSSADIQFESQPQIPEPANSQSSQASGVPGITESQMDSANPVTITAFSPRFNAH